MFLQINEPITFPHKLNDVKLKAAFAEGLDGDEQAFER